MRLYIWNLSDLDWGYFSVTVAARTEKAARELALSQISAVFTGYYERYRESVAQLLLRSPSEDDPTPACHWHIAPE